MSNPQKRRGDQAEREVATILNQLLGTNCKRALGAGRKDDVGDIYGLDDTCVQVANYRNLDRAVREKLPALERQQENAGATFAGLFVRRPGGRYVVVLTPEMWANLIREGLAVPQPMQPSEGG